MLPVSSSSLRFLHSLLSRAPLSVVTEQELLKKKRKRNNQALVDVVSVAKLAHQCKKSVQFKQKTQQKPPMDGGAV